MKKTKKLLSLALAIGLTAALACCGKGGTDIISVLTREEGSGTRGAFIELFGIEQTNADGKKVDKTVADAESTNSTAVMMTTVAGNAAAIGYVSLGSLDTEKVKALNVDGSSATAENIKNGSYKVVRPFQIAVKETKNTCAADFLRFIMSENGQKVVEDAGYISNGNTGNYMPSGVSGKLSIGGSSSVTPVMEKLKEAYIKKNPNVTVDIQQNDSTSGMTGVIDGIYDIGMASRELKQSETEKGLKPTVIALDGIAVIVNKENPLDNITSEQILKIYTGEITAWSEVE